MLQRTTRNYLRQIKRVQKQPLDLRESPEEKYFFVSYVSLSLWRAILLVYLVCLGNLYLIYSSWGRFFLKSCYIRGVFVLSRVSCSIFLSYLLFFLFHFQIRITPLLDYLTPRFLIFFSFFNPPPHFSSFLYFLKPLLPRFDT